MSLMRTATQPATKPARNITLLSRLAAHHVATVPGMSGQFVSALSYWEHHCPTKRDLVRACQVHGLPVAA